MSNYARYKKWWIENQAKDFIPSLYYGDDPETAFRQHINDMSSYELMETLEDWSEKDTIPTPVPNKFPYPQPLPTPFPRPFQDGPVPNQYSRNCSKCGMRLDQVMGYVCGDTHCPTFMKVTC